MGWGVFGSRLAVAAGMLAMMAPFDAPRAGQSTQYTYDALGRVLSAIDANGKKVVYTYDSAGNRTRVSNGAEFQEIIPTAWSASSNAGTTGLATANGLRDGDFYALTSIHATQSEASPWIMADLGSAQNVNHVDVAAAIASAVGAGPEDLNGTVIQYSTDGTTWSNGPTINSMPPGVTRSIALGGVSVRYLRIARATAGQVAIGDLRLYSAAAASSPLIAEPDAITTSGSAVTFDPRVNDRDLDGYAFTVSSAEAPSHGAVVINSGTSITYTPAAGYFGADGFTYVVADGHNGSASARVSVLVRSSVNHPPVAVADALTVSDRVTASVDGTNRLRPLNNDYDADGDVLTITGTTAPAHGLISVVGSNVITYQPTTAFDGADSFTYTISDGRGGSATATVSLTVANAPPVAGPDNLTTSRNTPITFDPRLNDSDPDGDTISVTAVATPGRGTATLNADQTITYTPSSAGGPIGDSFTYTLTDNRGASSIGWITVSVAPNRAPAALPDYITASTSAVTFDPRVNDSDPDGDPLTIVAVSTPSHGTAAVASAGAAVVYTMAGGYSGGDNFVYTLSDNQGATSTATVWVNSMGIEYLLVGGGGGGGADYGYLQGGAGGGGGGVVAASQTVTAASYVVAVGAGGGGGIMSARAGINGGGSTAFGATALGGGGGAGRGTSPGSGGSGGGSSSTTGAGGAGASGQGTAGGQPASDDHGGGGGGATTAGAPNGTGGQGFTSAISGGAVVYGSGGAGGGYCGAGGSWSASPGTNGGATGVAVSCGDGGAGNYGGGGGGGSSLYDPDTPEYAVGVGGAGGGGRVIIRYLGLPHATGGVITQSGGYTIHTFASSGTFVVP